MLLPAAGAALASPRRPCDDPKGTGAERSGRIPVRTHLRSTDHRRPRQPLTLVAATAAVASRGISATGVALIAALWLAAAATADTPLPAPRPQGAADTAGARGATEAAPPAASTATEIVPSPALADASPLPAPKALGDTPVLPAGLTPAAVAAAAKRRPASPATVAVPEPLPDGARPAEPEPPPPTVTAAPSAAASTAALRLPLRRPTETTTAAPVAAPPPAEASSPEVAASPSATPTATDPAGETVETPAVVAGAAPVLPRPAPARAAAAAEASPAGSGPVAAAAAVPVVPDTAAPAEPAATGAPTTLAYAPAPSEARPSPRWTARDGKLPPAARAPATAAPTPPAAVTPPPTAPGAPAIGTAKPGEADAPAAALPTVARPTSADCAALMAQGPAIVEAAPDLPQSGACGIERPVRLKALKMPDGRLVALSPAAELRCDMAAAATAWLRDDLVPALERGGTAVTAVKVADDYSCRPRNRVKGARMSEHGKGNAIDIGGFRLADGRVLEVAGNGLPKPFRITMRATACARFKTILGPGSDGYHENHIHVDLAQRRSTRSYCRWRIPGTDAS